MALGDAATTWVATNLGIEIEAAWLAPPDQKRVVRRYRRLPPVGEVLNWCAALWQVGSAVQSTIDRFDYRVCTPRRILSCSVFYDK